MRKTQETESKAFDMSSLSKILGCFGSEEISMFVAPT
jgi:hypothetical protein